jgi:hypothetical protein
VNMVSGTEVGPWWAFVNVVQGAEYGPRVGIC